LPEFPGQRAPLRGGESSPALKHGGFSVIALGSRVAEIVAELEPLLPARVPGDVVTLNLLALSLSRIERMAIALAAIDEGPREPKATARLREEQRAQSTQARRLLNDLAMTPTSRAKMVADLGVAGGDQLRQHLRERYGVVADG
jgi:hypothetical protein